jgi:ribosomal protein S17
MHKEDHEMSRTLTSTSTYATHTVRVQAQYVFSVPEMSRTITEQSKITITEQSKITITEQSKITITEQSKIPITEQSKITITEQSNITITVLLLF